MRLRGIERQHVLRYSTEGYHFRAEVTALPDTTDDMGLAKLLTREIVAELERSEVNEPSAPGIIAEVAGSDDYGFVADTVAAAVNLTVRDKQRILEASSVTDRLRWLLLLIHAEESVPRLERQLCLRVSRQTFRKARG